MGQYWIPVNLDKKEFIHPHKLATGLKLWEQVNNFPGTPCALLILTAAYYEKRGGGDLDLSENWHGRERTFPKYNVSPAPMFSETEYPKIAAAVHGRWAGDRIAVVGDYAEDSDLLARDKASTIYDRCKPETEARYSTREVEGKGGYWISPDAIFDGEPDPNRGKFRYFEEIAPAEFTDISEMVCKVIEHELKGKYEGEGWRDFIYDSDRKKSDKKGLVDMSLLEGGNVKTEDTV